MLNQINMPLGWQYLSSPLQIYGEKDKTRHEEPQCFPLDRNSLSQDLNEIRKNVKVKGLAVWQTPSLGLMQSSYMINMHQMNTGFKNTGENPSQIFLQAQF